MNPQVFEDALILTGPTASGKSALGVRIAERLGAEIVSMDSMALYRGLDILAAKPNADERERVTHHLLDVLDPWESATVSWWLDQAALSCEDIRSRGKRVLFVGGTPLYLKALLYGIFEGPGAEANLRKRLEEECESVGSLVLHTRLANIDPKTAERLHPNDARRIVRALEVWELTGKPLSAWQTQWNQGTRNVNKRGILSCIWLDRPREELYARIDARVHTMVRDGLIDEVAALRRLPHPISRQAEQAAGYREVCSYLDGLLNRDEMIALIQQRSRQLAKRQLTWMRSLKECHPADEQLTQRLWGSTIEGGEEGAIG